MRGRKKKRRRGGKEGKNMRIIEAMVTLRGGVALEPFRAPYRPSWDRQHAKRKERYRKFEKG